MNNFKDSLKEHFKDIQLSDDQFKQLQEIEVKKPRFTRSQFFLMGTAVAALLLAVVFTQVQSQSSQTMLGNIASEIAYNHAKQMRPEIFSSDIQEVSAFLGKLDFNLVAPRLLASKSWELIGARYCAIGGKIAAQLRLKHVKSGRVYTLYEAHLPDDLSEKEILASFEKSGSHVRVWEEKGLLMGIAGPDALASLD